MSLSVRLAGFNVDADLISDVVEIIQLIDRDFGSSGSSLSAVQLKAAAEELSARVRQSISPEAFTPETISAAYARISRDPSHVTELRRAARFAVARARKSNESIIFGLGHASVAEHAAFNFDVAGISRLASEELQSHRLLSFTEKSQRYISIGSAFVTPPEAQNNESAAIFATAIPKLFSAYDDLTQKMAARYLSESSGDLTKIQQRDLENRAKEDTRYLLPLACETQMGMTMNARNVEHVVCELSDHPLQELRDLGQAISTAVGSLAPSLVKYTIRGDYPRKNRDFFQRSEIESSPVSSEKLVWSDSPSVRIVNHTIDGEQRVLAALKFSSSYEQMTGAVPANEKKVWSEIFRNIGPHDSTFREFELATMTFEAEVSASCFAQLKRHRMMTLLSQSYSLDAGVIIPPSVREHGHEESFIAAIESSLNSARTIQQLQPALTPYILTNAQRKRVLMQTNARELYHIARLRCDQHAQWEIRSLGEQMLAAAKAIWPNMLALASGKDKFTDTYQTYFGR